jgi:hypothetical protein
VIVLNDLYLPCGKLNVTAHNVDFLCTLSALLRCGGNVRTRWIPSLAAIAVVVAVVIAMALPSVVSAAQKDEVLIDTVGARVPNSFWTIDPRFQPQIGQSFVLDRTVSATSVVLHPASIALAKKPKYLGMAYRAQNFTTLTGRGSVSATTVVNIWRSDSNTPLPVDPRPRKGGFDVAAGGFTNVYNSTYSVPFDLSKPFVLPLAPAVTLDPGVYLVAWYMQFPQDPVFGVRFEADVNGRSGGTWRGDEWIPSICKYAPIPDSSPPGSGAFIADQWASPFGVAPSGPFPGTIGYQTWFRAGTEKGPSEITGCIRPDFGGFDKKGRPIDKKGRLLKNPYDQKYYAMELGDIDMQLMGSVLSSGS